MDAVTQSVVCLSVPFVVFLGAFNFLILIEFSVLVYLMPT